jgi:hypothetical protein
VLLIAFVGSLVAAAVASRRKGGALSGATAAGASAALAVWVVHAGFDWDWQMPALTGTALLLAGGLLPEGRGRRRARRDTHR